MHANRERFALDLRLLDIGFEMNSALVMVVPVNFIQLQVHTAIVDCPVILEPIGLHQLFFKVAEDVLYVFHLSSPISLVARQ